MIDFLTQIIDDPDPQRKAEVTCSFRSIHVVNERR
jgi:hypothetical protein